MTTNDTDDARRRRRRAEQRALIFPFMYGASALLPPVRTLTRQEASELRARYFARAQVRAEKLRVIYSDEVGASEYRQ